MSTLHVYIMRIKVLVHNGLNKLFSSLTLPETHSCPFSFNCVAYALFVSPALDLLFIKCLYHLGIKQSFIFFIFSDNRLSFY